MKSSDQAEPRKGQVFVNASHPKRVRNGSGQIVGIDEAPVAGSEGVAAILKEAKMDRGTGRVKILTHLVETTAGRDVYAILKGGGRIGTSSRSRGVRQQGQHEGMFGRLDGQILQPGMVMDTFDFVTKPSVSQATETRAQLESEEPEEYEMENSKEELKEMLEAAMDVKEAERLEAEALDSLEAYVEELVAENEELHNDRAVLTQLSVAESEVMDHMDYELESHEGGEYITEGSEYIHEVDEQMAVLESQILAQQAEIDSRDADEYFRTACSSHSLGAIIYEHCAGKAGTVTEASAIFEWMAGVVESVSSTVGDPRSRALADVQYGYVNESMETNEDGQLKAGARLRALAGVK